VILVTTSADKLPGVSDIIGSLTQLGNDINKYHQEINQFRQNISNIATTTSDFGRGVVELCQQMIQQLGLSDAAREFRIEMIGARSPDRMADALNRMSGAMREGSWRLLTLIPAYQELDGCMVILWRPKN